MELQGKGGRWGRTRERVDKVARAHVGKNVAICVWALCVTRHAAGRNFGRRVGVKRLPFFIGITVGLYRRAVGFLLDGQVGQYVSHGW